MTRISRLAAAGFGVAVATVLNLLGRWAERSPGRAAWVGVACGLLGVLTVAAFWAALPPVLGAAAVYLGLVGRSGGRGAGTTATVLGAAALALGVAAYAGDVASRV